MADEHVRQAADHDPARHHETQVAQPAPGLEGSFTPESLPVAPGTLLGDPRLSGRGNTPVRAAVMRQAQRTYGNRAVQRYLQGRAAPGGASPPLALQRETPAAAAPPTSGPAPAGSAAAGPAAGPASGLIVDDAVAEADLQPGQMRRGAFLAQTRAAVQAAADEVLAGTPYAEAARPQIEQQMATYAGQDSRTLEASVRSQVPGAAGVRAATEYIPLIQAQVRTEIRAQLPPTTGVGGALAAVGGAVSSVVSSIGSAVSSVASLLFKGREGGARQGADAQAVAGQLQGGQGLDGRLRGGLEAAYGADLSGVRVHTDTRAASASDGLNARAFTVGQDIAFGTGEYQPGTLLGDALIAHEVAHVVQQGSGVAGGVQQKGADGGELSLEEDADRSAVGAMAAMWGGAQAGLGQVSENAMPRLRSGLGLRRCGRSSPAPAAPAVAPTPGDIIPFDHSPLSAPGETILFNDEYTHPTPADFKLVYTATGGKFNSAAGPTTKTVPGLISGNVPFIIDAAWDGASAVNVRLEVQRTSDNSVVKTETWTFGKKGTTPTTMTQVDTEGERPLGSTYTYKLGPDIGAPGGPDYEHQTILERFEQRTCNITVDDLKPEYATAHGLTTPEAITAHFFGTSSSNGTFTVNARDEVYDGHTGMADQATFIPALKAMKEIYVDLPQIYEVKPGEALARFTIRRILKTDGSKKLKKMRTGP